MTTRLIKTATATLFCSAALIASGAQAAATPGVGNKTVNAVTQKVYDNPSTTEKEMGVKTLQDYIVQEKEMWDWLFQNHPIFKYADEGRVKGVYKISTRGSEFLTGRQRPDLLQAGRRPSERLAVPSRRQVRA